MSDPGSDQDLKSVKPGMPVFQPEAAPSRETPQQESSGEADPDVIVKPGMSVGK